MDELDALARLPRRRHPSRRDLLASALTLGSTAPMSGLLLPGAVQAAVSPEAPPRSGGTLRLGLGGGSTTDSLDPRLWDDSVMIDVGFGIYNALVENSADNRPVPELASSYEPSDRAKTWVFTLRKDIAFHNGKPFDAKDAIYSLNLHRGQTTSGAAAIMKDVMDIKALDDHRIEVTLASANADFPTALTDYHLMMVPDGFTDWSKPVGTGAFTVESFDPGVRIVLKRAGAYWKPNRGYLDSVTFTVINETAPRMNALISGEVDAINRADPRTVSRIAKSPAFEIVRASGGWYPVMAMMVDHYPYNSLDVRQAMKYAIDRDVMIKALFSGYGSLGNDHPIPRGDPYFNTELPQIAYDPDKARFHFAKAGISGPGIVLQTSDAAFNGAVDMATEFQSTARQCDIPIAVKQEPADGYFSRIWLKGAFVASYWGGRPSATQMLEVAYKSSAPWNDSHWNNAAFDQLLAAAQAEADAVKRRPFIWDMQAMLTEQSGTLIPCFRDWLSAQNRKVGGHTPHSGFDMDNGRIAEKAWMKA